MSDHWLQYVPRDPTFRPGSEAAESSQRLLSSLLPEADSVESRFEERVRFFHPGANWSGVRCAACGADAEPWWGDAMDRASESEFRNLKCMAPCCGACVSLDGLRYLWPAASAQSLDERAAHDEVAHMASEEPAMQEAFSKARATLDDFLKMAAKPREGTSNYALKVAVSDGRNTEYFWVNRFAGNGDQFSGHLGYEPRIVKRYKFDERFTFNRAQIVDWTYVDQSANAMLGNFTACALLTKETAANAEAFKRRYGFKCS